MKYFVVSDVHSFLDEMMVALKEKGFEINNKEHILCVCGDLFDRGDQTVELFKFVKELQAQNRLIYIKGNHETLLEECMDEISMGYFPSYHHFSNGTIKTISQFCGVDERMFYRPTTEILNKVCGIMQQVLDFIKENCVDYAEISDYILVHGWVPVETTGVKYYGNQQFVNVHPEWADSTTDIGKSYWEEARWINGMEAWKKGMSIPNKTIVCGHWNCSYGWSHIRQERKEFPPQNHTNWEKSFEPFIDDGIIAIDACTAYSGIVNCVVLEG